jgi:carboxylesterase type B
MAGTALDEENGLTPMGGRSALLTRDMASVYAKNFESKESEFLELVSRLRDDEIIMGLTSGGSMTTRQLAVNQLRHGRKPIYMYCFVRRQPGDNSGASHGAEHQYVFQTLDRSWRPYCAADYSLSDIMADYWANFVKTGNPNGEGLTEWTPFTNDRPLTMMLDTVPFMAERELSKIQHFTLDYFTTTDEVHSLI